MPTLNSPFAASAFTDIAGRGEAVLTILPPSIPSLSTVSYNYPLKLLSRIPEGELESKYPVSATAPLHLYLLTYGGGLLPGDHIDVSVTVESRGRLVVTTPQGSTKIFKTEAQGGRKRLVPRVDNDRSKQTLRVQLDQGSGLCLLPDPSVPFAESRYDQFQSFTLLHESSSGNGHPRKDVVLKDPVSGSRGSLCVLDWVTEGRSARGENWSFDSWTGRNEVWLQDRITGKRRLLLRDSLILENNTNEPKPYGVSELNGSAKVHLPSPTAHTPVRSRAHPHSILGTLIIHGPLFQSLADFLMETFTSQPRIGGQSWASSSDHATFYPSGQKKYERSGKTSDCSMMKPSKEAHADVTWTAARVRNGFVLVKFGAPDFETARNWLGHLLRTEGTVQREFGEEALGSL